MIKCKPILITTLNKQALFLILILIPIHIDDKT